MIDFTGQVAIVTGAGRGLGRLYALDVTRRGSGFLKAIQPELVVPIVTFLASRACELTHHDYSACAGRLARVFVGLAEGWVAKADGAPTAEDIAAHLADVTSTERYTVPTSIVDEVLGLCGRLGINP